MGREDLSRHFSKEDIQMVSRQHEKMINITNHKINANQNYNEVPPYMGQNGHHSKNLQITNAGEGVEKREPSYTVGGNVNWYSLMANSMEIP